MKPPVILSLPLLLIVFPPCHSDPSSCCRHLRLESFGEASQHQNNRLGEFFISGLYGERPLFKLKDKEEYLFYLKSRGSGLWMVGPKVGKLNGGLANKGKSLCPESLDNNKWKFTDGNTWKSAKDTSISCLERTENIECIYNDSTEILGEDLHEDFGGGGIKTDTGSSAECIKECDKRGGCNYWTWIKGEGINCFLRTSKNGTVKKAGYISGSTSRVCDAQRLTEKEENPKFNTKEINGRFKITSLEWNEDLKNPNSIQFKDLANSIEESLLDMLEEEKELSEKVEFSVAVQRFTKGSVVCDFKVNYVNKDAWIAIPFAIKPSDISKAMGKNFKAKKGILFQRFLVAANSFNSSAPVDHCAAKGCSHKCDYDYDLADYVCTCPKGLTLGVDQLICLTEDQAEMNADDDCQESCKKNQNDDLDSSSVTEDPEISDDNNGDDKGEDPLYEENTTERMTDDAGWVPGNDPIEAVEDLPEEGLGEPDNDSIATTNDSYPETEVVPIIEVDESQLNNPTDITDLPVDATTVKPESDEINTSCVTTECRLPNNEIPDSEDSDSSIPSYNTETDINSQTTQSAFLGEDAKEVEDKDKDQKDSDAMGKKESDMKDVPEVPSEDIPDDMKTDEIDEESKDTDPSKNGNSDSEQNDPTSKESGVNAEKPNDYEEENTEADKQEGENIDSNTNDDNAEKDLESNDEEKNGNESLPKDMSDNSKPDSTNSKDMDPSENNTLQSDIDIITESPSDANYKTEIEVKNSATEESSLEDSLDPTRQQIDGENVLEVTETTTAQDNVDIDDSPLTENSIGDIKTSTEKSSGDGKQSSSNTDNETLTTESNPEGTTTTEDILNEAVEESTEILPSMIEGEDIENDMNSNKDDHEKRKQDPTNENDASIDLTINEVIDNMTEQPLEVKTSKPENEQNMDIDPNVKVEKQVPEDTPSPSEVNTKDTDPEIDAKKADDSDNSVTDQPDKIEDEEKDEIGSDERITDADDNKVEKPVDSKNANEDSTMVPDSPSIDPKDSTSDKREFDCEELPCGELDTTPEEIPLKCSFRDGLKPRKVYLVIEASKLTGENSRFWEENVKVLIKDLMVMDISPK